MNFTTPLFVLAFPLVAALYAALPAGGRPVLLLAVSWLFYAYGGLPALALLLLATLVSWLCARGVAAGHRVWLWVEVATALGLLAIFKYGGFLFGWQGVLLPAGISFYTFQTMSYVLDVARGRADPEPKFWRYALFVSFFPQLVAGPIERPGDLLPQLHAARRPTRADVCDGGWRMLRGFFKKVAVADTVAVWVEPVFAAPHTAAGPAVVLAAVLFAVQIYCDFSGYSDIALGAARVLGVRLSENFRTPYRAESLRDFWRRWHISLTRWLTDYLYIPLGGYTHRARNLLLVFLCSGLWHGAGWNFIAWGLIHALGQLAEEHLPAPPPKLRRVLVFAFCCVGWVVFRAANLTEAAALLAALPHGWAHPLQALVLTGLQLADLPRLVLLLAVLSRWDDDPRPAAHRPLVLGAALGCVGLLWLTRLAGGAANTFLYFQF